MLFIILLIFIIVVGICVGISIISIMNTIIDMEGLIEAQYAANKHFFELMWKKIIISAKITEHKTDKLKSIFIDLILQKETNFDNLLVSIKKINPDLSSTIVTELQRIISITTRTCANNQFAITERISEYNEYIQKHSITNKFLNRKKREVEYQI